MEYEIQTQRPKGQLKAIIDKMLDKFGFDGILSGSQIFFENPEVTMPPGVVIYKEEGLINLRIEDILVLRSKNNSEILYTACLLLKSFPQPINKSAKKLQALLDM